MRKVLRFSVWVLAVFFVLMAGAFMYLRNADLSVYEDQIEGFLSKTIGHKLDVDGLFELHFGKLTEVTAEQITLANADWQTDPVIASVGHLSVSVDLWSLISGPIIIEKLDIRNVRIRLEKDDKAQANYATGRVRDESEPKVEFDRGLIAFWNVQVQDVQFAYLDPARRRPLNIELEQLTVSPDENHVLDLDLNGIINEIPVWADGKLGPWQNLLDGHDILADLDLTLGQIRISIDGSVDNLPRLVGTELTLSINGPAIENVTGRLGLPPFAEGAFGIDGRITKLDIGSQLRLDGNFGAIKIFASGTADSLIEFNKAQLDFNFSGPDTQYVAEVFGIDGAPAVPFLVTGDLNKDGKRLTFSGTRVQLGENTLGIDGWLDFKGGVPDGDVAVKAFGPDFSVVGPFAKVPGMPAEAFEIDGRIQKSGASVRFDEVVAIVGENRIVANGAIGGQGSPDTEISFSASGPDISILGPMTGLQGIQPRAFDISAIVKPDPVGIRIEEAKGDFGEIQIGVDGVVGTAKGQTGTDLSVRAGGTDLRYVALLAGVPYLPEGPFNIGARARIDENGLRLSEGTADVGGMSATVEGAVALGGDTGAFGFDLSVSGPDLAEALPFEWLDRLAGEAFLVEGRINHRAGRFELDSVSASISDFEIDVEGDFLIADRTGAVTIHGSSPDAEELRKLIGLAHLPDGAVSVGGRIEKLEAELEFSDVTVRIGEYSIGADGTLSNAPLSNSSDLRFSGSGPELLEIGLIFDYDELPAKRFSVTGEVNGIPTGFAIEKLVAKIGENDIDGRFTADLRDKPEVEGYLSSTYIDLSRRTAPADEESTQVDASTGEYLFSDDPLALEWLDAANVDVEIKTGRLRLQQSDLRNFQIGITLSDGTLDIDPVSFKGPEGGLTGRLRLEPSNGSHALEASLLVENVYLGVMGSEDQDRSTLPPLNGRLDLRSTGDSMHALMAASNGNLSFTHGEGRARNLFGGRIFGDVILQVMRALNPMRKANDYTNVECGIYSVGIEGGVATIETLALQSDKMTVVTNGNINFDDERLDVSLRAKNREGIGISIGGVANSFLKLGGTLNSPQLKIDAASSVATTGAAVATGGLSLLAKGLWDRVSAEASICKDLPKEEVSP